MCPGLSAIRTARRSSRRKLSKSDPRFDLRPGVHGFSRGDDCCRPVPPRARRIPQFFRTPCNSRFPRASWLGEADQVTTAGTYIDELPILMPLTSPVAGFAELYERHYEAVFRAALRVTGNPADAEDVLQTVFLRIIARGAQGGDVEDVALPAAYFRRAAVNAAVDVLRRRELRADSVYDDSAPHAAVQSPLLLKERLRRAVAVLDSEDAS